MRTVITLFINVLLIAWLLSLLGGDFSQLVEWGILGMALLLSINWLYGWVSVLRAEWRARRKPELEDPGEPVDSGIDPMDTERFRRKVKDTRGRLSAGGIGAEELRRQQDRLARFMKRKP